jgi:hypothetical protein
MRGTLRQHGAAGQQRSAHRNGPQHARSEESR